jgi:hypothetical protein
MLSMNPVSPCICCFHRLIENSMNVTSFNIKSVWFAGPAGSVPGGSGGRLAC